MNIETPAQKTISSSAVSVLNFNTVKERSLSEKLTSFFVSVYEEGIDGRNYQYKRQDLMVYNKNNQKIQRAKIRIR